MSDTLYDITAEVQAAFDQLYVDDDGVVQGMAALEEVTARFEDKAEAVACYIKQLQAESEALQNEEDALYNRRQAKDRKAAWLTRYLASCILAAGRDRFETSKVDCRFRRSSRVIVQDIDRIPTEFVREKLDRQADKKAIKDAIKAGRDIPGAELYEEQKLNIK